MLTTYITDMIDQRKLFWSIWSKIVWFKDNTIKALRALKIAERIQQEQKENLCAVRTIPASQ